jgi:hypothetical protein
MTTVQWQWVEETNLAVKARGLAVAQKPDEASFWERTDLLYLGDLTWTGWPGEGYEYIADLMKRDNDGFQYTYGLVGLSDEHTVGQTMVCQVKDSISDPLGFEMYVGGTWQIGPLSMWLETLTPAVQTQAKERYRNLVAWVRQSLQD